MSSPGEHVYEVVCGVCRGHRYVARQLCEACRGDGYHHFTAHDYEPKDAVPLLLKEQDRAEYEAFRAEVEALWRAANPEQTEAA